jgi:hypothetical protein
MKRNSNRAALVALAAILVSLTLSLPSSATVIGQQFKPSASVGGHFIQAGQCWRRVGPFQTQNQAYQMQRDAQNRGYATGPVFGEGGLYSNYSNRRWFFTVYYTC